MLCFTAAGLCKVKHEALGRAVRVAAQPGNSGAARKERMLEWK